MTIDSVVRFSAKQKKKEVKEAFQRKDRKIRIASSILYLTCTLTHTHSVDTLAYPPGCFPSLFFPFPNYIMNFTCILNEARVLVCVCVRVQTFSSSPASSREGKKNTHTFIILILPVVNNVGFLQKTLPNMKKKECL